MKSLFSLGELYVSDFLKPGESPRSGKHEMKMMFDDRYTKAVRLEQAAPLETLYGKYWYRSGINKSMRDSLKNVVDDILSIPSSNYQKGDVWLDIACNDGTLLSFVDSNIFQRIGIDPADDSYKMESINHADVIIQDYFSMGAYQKAISKPAKIITCIAMFYDLETPEKFLNDVVSVMDDDGLFVCQMSYTPLMLNQLAFDNICHEHIYYYTLVTIKRLFERCGLRVVDCTLNEVNGGSFRVFAKKAINAQNFSTRPFRDVANFRVNSLLQYEYALEYNNVEVWEWFYREVKKLKKKTVDFITQEKAKGKKIWGYGASTKGNTLLQYFDLDHTLIDAIADRSPYKHGLYTVGTNIPILSEEEMRLAKPDYLLILPWHFIDEFAKREKEYLENGGKFIVPCPRFEIIG